MPYFHPNPIRHQDNVSIYSYGLQCSLKQKGSVLCIELKVPLKELVLTSGTEISM